MIGDYEKKLIHSIYGINNKEILLSDNEPVELFINNEKLVGKTKIVIKMRPTPRLIFQIPFAKQPLQKSFALLNIFNEEVLLLKFPLKSISIRAAVVSVQHGMLILTDSGKPIIINTGEKLKHIIFHIPNFSEFIGKQDLILKENGKGQRIGRILLFAGRWRVTINSVSNIKEIINSLKSYGGINITHVGMIEREDNSCFAAEQVNNFLSALMHFFSFCRGIWCPPILAVGFNLIGEKVWEEWSIRRTSDWRPLLSWFDKHHAEVLGNIFPGFIDCWENIIWGNSIRLAIYWYIQSNTGAGGVDGSIILIQAALELLAWVYLVEDKGFLDSRNFKKLKASDRLRKLLSCLDIPLGIPKSLTKLIKIGKKEKWLDGPHAFTDIRNDIVHPDKKKGYGKQKLPLVEIWNLGLWYIELVLLRLFNYKGLYSERVQTERWVGDVELVPWARINT